MSENQPIPVPAAADDSESSKPSTQKEERKSSHTKLDSTQQALPKSSETPINHISSVQQAPITENGTPMAHVEISPEVEVYDAPDDVISNHDPRKSADNGPSKLEPTTNQEDAINEWIDKTNEPLGEIGNGYELTSTLESLCLTNNRIRKIERLEPCVKLAELILRQNSITVIEGLDTLQNLVELDLYMNAITEIPSTSFSKNSKLKRLDLSFNKLRSLDRFPSENLSNLEELYLIGNKIAKITHLRAMPKLMMLELGDNRIRALENLDQLSSLQSLWLGRNKITKIENLEPLCDLRKLSLQSNRITIIEGLSHFSRLEELYLSHNGLKSMRGVEDLKSLRLLDLGSNQIERIEGVTHLRLLKEFWFNDNALATFDDLHLLSEAVEIETVYLEGNPIAHDPEYQQKVLDVLPDSLEQLDALLVTDVRQEISRKTELRVAKELGTAKAE